MKKNATLVLISFVCVSAVQAISIGKNPVLQVKSKDGPVRSGGISADGKYAVLKVRKK